MHPQQAAVFQRALRTAGFIVGGAGIVGIVIGSTVKGLLTGVIVGYFATKVHSLALGILFGLAVGAFFAYLILLMNPGHALNIMLPGSLVGLIVGYTAQQHQS